MAIAKEAFWHDQYRDKVYGGWAGKNIGGTLGGPLEGQKRLMDYDFYPSLPDGPLANDDLDLQLVWLHALETYGPRLQADDLAREWKEHIFFPFDEYGYALTNMRKGLRPPVSGWFDNPFIDCMGSPIRSEIWAMVCPGEPELAAYYAYHDAITDHAGGEGVYGEMFFAAIESAAFVESDYHTLIEIGLSVIPAESRVARAVRDTVAWHRQGIDWVACREKILEHHGHPNFTDAPQNIAFTILGWLYGSDFGEKICKAVNCGYDTDCTGATLGAILGIIHGAQALPARWTEPLGDGVVVSPAVRGFPAPKTLTELTERTLRAAQEVKAYWAGRPRPSLQALWQQRPQSMIYWIPKGSSESPGLKLTVDYADDGPSVYPGQSVSVDIGLHNQSADAWNGQIRFSLPDGWSGAQELPFTLDSGEIKRSTVTFQAGPDSRPAYHVGMAVERNHNGFLWTSDREDLVFVKCIKWEIESPSGDKVTAITPGGRIDFSKVFANTAEGVYRLRTTLETPTSRKGRLVLGTGNPVRVVLDGQEILNDPNRSDPTTAPAYHRGRGVAIDVSAGVHTLEIELTHSQEAELGLHVSFVASHEGKEPGPYFSYIDATLG